jgi:hypothetical protein
MYYCRSSTCLLWSHASEQLCLMHELSSFITVLPRNCTTPLVLGRVACHVRVSSRQQWVSCYEYWDIYFSCLYVKPHLPQ